MSELDLGQDILRYVLRRGGEILPGDTDEMTADHLIDTKIAINQAYWWLCGYRSWRWARKFPPVQFISTAKVTATVSSISGNTLTLSAALSPSMADRKVFLDAEGIPHRVDTHQSGTTSVVLETNYVGTQTSGACTFFQDEITVASDILAFPNIQELHLGDDLDVISESEFRHRIPRNVREGTRSEYAAFITDSKIRIGPWTAEARLFECSYNYRPDPLTFDGNSVTDTPIVPRNNRICIGLKALVDLFGDKRDGRIEVIQKQLETCVQAMGTIETTFAKPRGYVPRGHRVTG